MKLISYFDYRNAAKRKLPAPIFHYLDGAADDEWSFKNNSSAFEKYMFNTSYLNDVSSVNMKTKILGCELDVPVILAPTGMTRIFHHEKEIGAAKAAKKHGLGYALSTLSTTSIEDVAISTDGPKIFQIYIHKDRSLTDELIDRCKAAGYKALCLTVDTAVGGNRERDVRYGFTMPPKMTLASLFSFAIRPHWSLNFLRHPDIRLANLIERNDDIRSGNPLRLMDYVNSQFDRSVTWDDVGRFIDRWGGPFAIKGLQSPEDAKKAREIGASAIMISNHGGRQLDATPAPVDCIAPIRDAIGDDLELILDGGVRRGNHVIKALALGANAVSFGRPYLYALAAGGQRGLESYLDLFVKEIERNLALIGCNDIRKLDHSFLVQYVDM